VSGTAAKDWRQRALLASSLDVGVITLAVFARPELRCRALGWYRHRTPLAKCITNGAFPLFDWQRVRGWLSRFAPSLIPVGHRLREWQPDSSLPCGRVAFQMHKQRTMLTVSRYTTLLYYTACLINQSTVLYDLVKLPSEAFAQQVRAGASPVPL
jgi:hypothetical protein